VSSRDSRNLTHDPPAAVATPRPRRRRVKRPKPVELTPVLRRKMRTTTAAARVRWAREQLNGGVSQEVFAELVGTTRRHVIRLEKGRGNGDGTNAGPETRAALSKATGLPEEFFLDGNTRR
jgi:DNA-binding XRE family transcriptional regulator